MARILDVLLPKSFLSDAQTVFEPIDYGTIAGDAFTPDRSDGGMYQNYLDKLQEGFLLNPEAYDVLTMSKEERESYFADLGISDNVGDYYEGLFDPSSEYYGFVDPSQTSDVDLFSGQSIMEGFGRAGMPDVTKNMARPLQLSTLRKLDPTQYSGQMAEKRQTLSESLATQREKASQLGGGFAGYGKRNIAEDLAQEKFRTGVESVQEGINKQRATALQDLYTELENYRSTLSDYTG